MRSERTDRTRTWDRPATATCEHVADALPGVIDGSARLDGLGRDHVEHCLRCQAELAQYRKLLRAMHSLRPALVDAPDGSVADVLAHLEAAGERSAVRAALSGRRVAYLGGIAATAAAAGAGAVIVLSNRGRKSRFPLAG